MGRFKWHFVIPAIIASGLPAFAAPPADHRWDPAPLWAGIYGGPNVGYAFGNKKWLDNFPTPDGELDADATVKGFTAGLQGGYNWQFSHLLLGIEGDFTWSNANATFSCFSFGDQVCSAKPEWFASLAGRLGYIEGPWLFYLKGGPAWAEDHFEDTATCAGSQPRSRAGITAACGDSFFANQTRFGWLAGLGIEYYFARQWSAKAEYDFMDFGSRSVSFSDGGSGFFTEEIHQKMNLFKIGLNYHFEPARPAYASAALGYAPSAVTDEEERDNYVTAFGGFDVSKYSYSGLAGALISPYKDLDTSGLRFWILGDTGWYKYPAGDHFINGHYESGDVLAGYSFEGDNYSIALMAGLNAVNHTLSEVDTTNPVQGTAFGFKVRGDATVNPTPQTLTAAEAEYSTAFQTYYSRLKLGYDVTNGKQIFVGPEVAAMGDERYNQWRVGAHVSQLKFHGIEFDVSTGFAHDSVVGDGAYGTIEVSTNF